MFTLLFLLLSLIYSLTSLSVFCLFSCSLPSSVSVWVWHVKPWMTQTQRHDGQEQKRHSSYYLADLVCVVQYNNYCTVLEHTHTHTVFSLCRCLLTLCSSLSCVHNLVSLCSLQLFCASVQSCGFLCLFRLILHLVWGEMCVFSVSVNLLSRKIHSFRQVPVPSEPLDLNLDLDVWSLVLHPSSLHVPISVLPPSMSSCITQHLPSFSPPPSRPSNFLLLLLHLFLSLLFVPLPLSACWRLAGFRHLQTEYFMAVQFSCSLSTRDHSWPKSLFLLLL